MYGIGTSELIVLLFVALIVLGPKRLPEIARSIGKGVREFKRSLDDKLEESADSAASDLSPLHEQKGLQEEFAGRDERGVSQRKLSLIEHLAELRGRLIICAAGVLVGMIVAYYIYDPLIFNLLKGPLDVLAGRLENPFVFDNYIVRVLRSRTEGMDLGLNLHFIGPIEAFTVQLKASLFVGIILSCPLTFFHLWRFISTGLTSKERRAITVLPLIGVVLFLTGAVFAYIFMLPFALYFLVVVIGRGLIPTLILSKYVSMVTVCCLAFGIVFEMPLVILFLTRIGVVTPHFLRAKRKFAIPLIFLVAAVLTPPPDVATQIMMALPMMVLYEASILLSWLVWSKRKAAE